MKILALEYENDNLSEEKGTNLSKEVFSLQLVVEMRSEEVRLLKEKLSRTTQELEEAEILNEKLEKAKAKVEDLEEQIKIKNRMEKYSSLFLCTNSMFKA